MNNYTEPVWCEATFVYNYPKAADCIKVSISTVDEFYNAILWYYGEFLNVENICPILFCYYYYRMDEIEDKLLLLIKSANFSTKLKLLHNGNHS